MIYGILQAPIVTFKFFDWFGIIICISHLIPQEYVCGDKGVNCSWGQAINVANRYIYVTQPLKDRVLVISKIQMVVVDVRIFTASACYKVDEGNKERMCLGGDN